MCQALNSCVTKSVSNDKTQKGMNFLNLCLYLDFPSQGWDFQQPESILFYTIMYSTVWDSCKQLSKFLEEPAGVMPYSSSLLSVALRKPTYPGNRTPHCSRLDQQRKLNYSLWKKTGQDPKEYCCSFPPHWKTPQLHMVFFSSLRYGFTFKRQKDKE